MKTIEGIDLTNLIFNDHVLRKRLVVPKKLTVLIVPVVDNFLCFIHLSLLTR